MILLTGFCFAGNEPLLGSERLEIVHHEENRVVSAILDRIRQLFIGNFDYLTLLEANLSSQIQSHMQIQFEIQRELNGIRDLNTRISMWQELS